MTYIRLFRVVAFVELQVAISGETEEIAGGYIGSVDVIGRIFVCIWYIASPSLV